MKTQTDIEKQLGELHSFEIEDLDLIVRNLQAIIAEPQVDIALLDQLEDCESVIHILKTKLYKRLISLLKTNHMV